MTHKLLVVDDDPGIAKVMGLMARQLGWEARWVADPHAAVAGFLEFRPDVVVIDMIMPAMDGIEVLHDVLLTGVPSNIVLTSGYGDAYLRLAEGVARFHETSIVATLQKPFRRQEFLDVLSRLGTAAA